MIVCNIGQAFVSWVDPCLIHQALSFDPERVLSIPKSMLVKGQEPWSVTCTF